MGLAGFIVCGGVYGLITSFNRPKFLVPPQHRGEPGAIAGRRRRRREGVPLRNASGAPGAVDRATFERPVAGEEPSAAVPDNPAMIMVERRVTGGKRDSQRNYLVIVDGRRVATVRGGQTAEVRVSPGRHDVLLKMNWCTSPTLVIDARPGAIVRLACEPGGPDAVPLRDMAVNRKSYINLFRV